jgi:lipid A 4'-phosphatase
VVAGGLFTVFPTVDLVVSGLFFDGQVFPIQQSHWVEAIRLGLYASEYIGAFAALGLAIMCVWRKGAILRLDARDWFYGFSVFVLGPGLLVNGILKRDWGRARPWQVAEFGGPAHFSQPWQISDQCLTNCSFVSGEMAGACALALLLALILRANRAVILLGVYWAGVAVVLAIPMFTAWQRIAAGRHFLSDVVFAALFVTLLASLLERLFYRKARMSTAVDIPRDSP